MATRLELCVPQSLDLCWTLLSCRHLRSTARPSRAADAPSHQATLEKRMRKEMRGREREKGQPRQRRRSFTPWSLLLQSI